MGVGRLDRRRRPRLHPRQRRRARPPARRPRRPAPSPSCAARTASCDRRRRREGDLCGHGTACAGIIRALAPECRARRASACSAPATPAAGEVLLAGLRWAIEQGFDVVNMSLSTTQDEVRRASCTSSPTAPTSAARVLVASAHNMPVESFPWRFASVISVGSHEEPDPLDLLLQPVAARRVLRARPRPRRRVAGRRRRSARTGNSFATPHIAGVCALVLAKHPELTPFQLKSVLYLTATNVGRRSMSEPRRGRRGGRARGGRGAPRAAAVDRRGGARDLRRQGRVGLPARRGRRRARLRGGRRRGRGRPDRHALPGRHRHRRLGARRRGSRS